MTLDAAEFIRRFLLHVLPSGFHRIRHYGLFAGTVRARNIERVRQVARRARGLARALARRGGQRGRNRFACAPMPVLRRPDDHRRNLRRPAPCAIAIAEPDQDRHLMTVAALPASQRRIAFASSRAPEQERDVLTTSAQSSPDRRAHARRPRILAIKNARRRPLPPTNTARLRPPPPRARSVRDPQIPIGRARPNSALPPRGFLLARLSNAGPAPSPRVLQRAGVRNPSVKRSLRIVTVRLWLDGGHRGHRSETSWTLSLSAYRA